MSRWACAPRRSFSLIDSATMLHADARRTLLKTTSCVFDNNLSGLRARTRRVMCVCGGHAGCGGI